MPTARVSPAPSTQSDQTSIHVVSTNSSASTSRDANHSSHQHRSNISSRTTTTILDRERDASVASSPPTYSSPSSTTCGRNKNVIIKNSSRATLGNTWTTPVNTSTSVSTVPVVNGHSPDEGGGLNESSNIKSRNKGHLLESNGQIVSDGQSQQKQVMRNQSSRNKKSSSSSRSSRNDDNSGKLFSSILRTKVVPIPCNPCRLPRHSNLVDSCSHRESNDYSHDCFY